MNWTWNGPAAVAPRLRISATYAFDVRIAGDRLDADRLDQEVGPQLGLIAVGLVSRRRPEDFVGAPIQRKTPRKR